MNIDQSTTTTMILSEIHRSYVQGLVEFVQISSKSFPYETEIIENKKKTIQWINRNWSGFGWVDFSVNPITSGQYFCVDL